MLHGNLILLCSIPLLLLINAQYDDERDLTQETSEPVRSSKSSFDAHFQRGQCPARFYQIGNECVYFATDGKRYSWYQAQRLCARRTARLLEGQTALGNDQNQTKPTKGVRQFILNTPEKTKILQSLFREYEEVNFAVHLPADYNTLPRCNDGKDDYWPQYCGSREASNGTCFETSELGFNNICLRQIDCNNRSSRLTCEFTLPGSPELTASRFRHCPKTRGLRGRLSVWAWLLIAVGAMLLLLFILGGVLAYIRNSSKGSSELKQPPSERRSTGEEATPVLSARHDPAAQPMLVRATPSNASDTDYLQPQPLKRAAPPTIPTTKTLGQVDTVPYL